jgi:hypothetical protein
MGATTTTPRGPRAHSNDSSTSSDLRRCARCGEQNQYCHGHTPFVPNSSLDLPPNPPRITMSGSVPPDGMARFNLSHAEASALAANLTSRLGEDHQNAAPVPPVRDYREEFARVVAESLGISTATAAEGLGLRSRRGRRGGQGRGNRSNTIPDNERPRHTQPTPPVTNLQGPPSERTQMEKIRNLKSFARQYARDRGSCDDTRISYLEYVESEAEADWTLARMIAG